MGEDTQRPTQDLSGECWVIRVVRPGEVTEALDSDGKSRLRPKSSEFSATPGQGEGMSVFLVDDLPPGLDPAKLLNCGLFEEGSTMWVHALSTYRGEGLEIVRDAIEEFPGHALVRKPDGGRFNSGLRTRLAKTARPGHGNFPQ